MSMIPLVFRDWWDDFELPRTSRASRLVDQHFGTGLSIDDLMNAMTTRQTNRYYRPWRQDVLQPTSQDTGSTISKDKDKFQVILDVQQFSPKELTVKVQNNTIVVEGKHEEKQDEHGYISRHFVRKYILPQGHELTDIVSSLSSDGILTVTAPRKAEQPAITERSVPILQTGPAKPISPGPVSTNINIEQQPKVESPN